MKKKTKHFAQYFLAGMVAFFGGKAKADNSKNTTPENAQTSMTAQNTTTTNKPNFTEVKLPTQNTPTNKLITIKIDSAKALNQGRTLYHQARDLLCLNEGCHTNGYRCSAL